MAQLLILKNDTISHTRGDIVEIRPSASPFGGLEPDSFYMVDISDAIVSEFIEYANEWDTILNYNVINSDLINDVFQIELSATTNVSEVGGITRDQVETYINKWSGTVNSFSNNTVTFTISIFNAIKSSGFWNKNTDNVIWTELDYTNGVHTVQADFTNVNVTSLSVEDHMSEKGANIISNNNNIIVFSIDRATIRNDFQSSIIRKVKRQIKRRRYYLPENILTIIDSNGGTYTTTKATALLYIKDKLDD